MLSSIRIVLHSSCHPFELFSTRAVLRSSCPPFERSGLTKRYHPGSQFFFPRLLSRLEFFLIVKYREHVKADIPGSRTPTIYRSGVSTPAVLLCAACLFPPNSSIWLFKECYELSLWLAWLPGVRLRGTTQAVLAMNSPTIYSQTWHHF